MGSNLVGEQVIVISALDSPKVGKLVGWHQVNTQEFPIIWTEDQGPKVMSFGPILLPYDWHIFKSLCDKGIAEAYKWAAKLTNVMSAVSMRAKR